MANCTLYFRCAIIRRIITIHRRSNYTNHEKGNISAPQITQKTQNRIPRKVRDTLRTQRPPQQKTQRPQVSDPCINSQYSVKAGNLTAYSALAHVYPARWCGYCICGRRKNAYHSAVLSAKNKVKHISAYVEGAYFVRHSGK